MRAVFRVDASQKIGTGHVNRCLTLAAFMRAQGWQIYFLSRNLEGNLLSSLEKSGHGLLPLPGPRTKPNQPQIPHHDWLECSFEQEIEDTLAALETLGAVDLIVVDHYAIDRRWEIEVAQKAKHILVIDDLADREHRCHLLMDANLYPDFENRYDSLLPPTTKKLLGPSYYLLREEFIPFRQRNFSIAALDRALLFFGGADSVGLTERAISAIKKSKLKAHAWDVIVGPSNSRSTEIQKAVADLKNGIFHLDPPNFALLLHNASWGLCSGGLNTWERCFLGLPTTSIAAAENQVPASAYLSTLGFQEYLGIHSELDEAKLIESLDSLPLRFSKLTKMGEKSQAVVDGQGTKRIMEAITALQ